VKSAATSQRWLATSQPNTSQDGIDVALVTPQELFFVGLKKWLPIDLDSAKMDTDRAKAEQVVGLPDFGREDDRSRLGTCSQILWCYMQILGS